MSRTGRPAPLAAAAGFRGTVLTVALVGVVGVLAPGCGIVSRPDAAAWDQQARRSLTDAASQVSTARLALETAAERRTWPAYATVVVAKAEEAAGTAEEDLARLQAPPQRADAAATVLDLLDEAVSLVAEARAHAVEGRYDDSALLDDLDRIAGELEQAAP